MKRMTSAILALLVNSCLVAGVFAGSAESIEQAQKLMAMNDGRAAVRVLENALVDAGNQRPAVVAQLKKAYELAIRQAEAAGRKGEAEAFREDLGILKRIKAGTRTEPAPTPSLAKIEPPTPLPAEAPTAAPAPQVEHLPVLTDDQVPPPVRRERAAEPQAQPVDPLPKPIEPVEQPKALEPLPEPEPVAQTPMVPITEGDAAFRAKNYEQAGKIYGELASAGRLPADRKDHWAYCRWFAVVQRINAKPKTNEEWEAIDAEIEEIKKLTPRNFFGEYLKKRAATRIPGSGKTVAKSDETKSDQVIIRGQTPAEPPAKLLREQTPAQKPVVPPAKPASPAPLQAPAQPTNVAPPQAKTSGQWQIRETPNFRILHADDGLADQVARVAEDTRDEQFRKWAGASPAGSWAPKCDIYIYPSAQIFQQMTGQPGDSPGFSTMGLNDGRIIARRINLRVDARGLVPAVLPHEVTHVVLADLFTREQIPRWADEGMAVLSEPAGEQLLRAQDLDEPLKSGRLFKMADLLVMDYPDGEYWSLYYAQSVSLTKYLVERGSPPKFIQFLNASERNGLEVALQQLYGFKNYQDLQDQWIASARATPGVVTAIGGSNSARATRE